MVCASREGRVLSRECIYLVSGATADERVEWSEEK